MTKSEYQELVEFLRKKFSRIDQQFQGVDRRFDAVDQRLDRVEIRLTRVEVFAEENRDQIKIVAEGLTSLRTEMHAGFADLRAEMAEGFRTQGDVIRDLGRRVDRLEARIA